jgi:hypothetical protein
MLLLSIAISLWNVADPRPHSDWGVLDMPREVVTMLVQLPAHDEEHGCEAREVLPVDLDDDGDLDWLVECAGIEMVLVENATPVRLLARQWMGHAGLLGISVTATRHKGFRMIEWEEGAGPHATEQNFLAFDGRAAGAFARSLASRL